MGKIINVLLHNFLQMFLKKRKSLCCHMQEFKSDEVYSNLLENNDNKELLEICLFI